MDGGLQDPPEAILTLLRRISRDTTWCMRGG